MSNQMNILKADEIKAEIAFDFSSVEGIRWINPPDSEDILIAGFPWIEEDRIYRRLPLRVKDMLRPPVDALANNTAGGQLHFTTDSNRLYIAVKMPWQRFRSRYRFYLERRNIRRYRRRFYP
jgi:hypothetical protein